MAIAGVVVLFSPISPFGSRNSGGGGGAGGLLGFVLDTADELQQWCGRQLLAIANDHLGPELKFERIDYAPPATVTLTNVTLDSGATRLLAAASIRVTLAETPRRGKPIVIESVRLNAPEFHVVESEAGEITGFDGLVKPAGGSLKDDGGSTRLSDVFAIRHIVINDGSVIYMQPNEPVMRLDGLSADLDTSPAADESGSWYTIACDIDRAPLASLSLNGKFDLDSLTLDLASYEFEAQLSPGQYEMLPPGVQVMLSEHQVQGDVKINGSGTVRLRDFSHSTINATCELNDVNMTLEDYRVQIQSGSLAALLHDKSVKVDAVALKAFGGEVDLIGQFKLASAAGFTALVRARGVQLSQLSSGSPDAPDGVKGLLTGECRATGSLPTAGQPMSLAGNGSVEIVQAQLVKIPVIDGLVKAMKKVSTVGERTDRGSGAFELHDDRMTLTTFEFVSQSIAARGEGDVKYDGTLDLKVNAGPLEKIQGALGRVGDIFGKITDKIMSYRITGSVEQPKYAVESLGIKLKVPFIGGKSENKPGE